MNFVLTSLILHVATSTIILPYKCAIVDQITPSSAFVAEVYGDHSKACAIFDDAHIYDNGPIFTSNRPDLIKQVNSTHYQIYAAVDQNVLSPTTYNTTIQTSLTTPPRATLNQINFCTLIQVVLENQFVLLKVKPRFDVGCVVLDSQPLAILER